MEITGKNGFPRKMFLKDKTGEKYQIKLMWWAENSEEIPTISAELWEELRNAIGELILQDWESEDKTKPPYRMKHPYDFSHLNISFQKGDMTVDQLARFCGLSHHGEMAKAKIKIVGDATFPWSEVAIVSYRLTATSGYPADVYVLTNKS